MSSLRRQLRNELLDAQQKLIFRKQELERMRSAHFKKMMGEEKARQMRSALEKDISKLENIVRIRKLRLIDVTG